MPPLQCDFLMMCTFSYGQLFLVSIFYQLTSEKNEVRTIQQFLISCTVPVYSDSTLSRCCCITASSRERRRRKTKHHFRKPEHFQLFSRFIFNPMESQCVTFSFFDTCLQEGLCISLSGSTTAAKILVSFRPDFDLGPR